jgi:hypothetical protein
LSFIVENCGPVAVKELDLLCAMLEEAGGRFLTAGALAEEYRVNEMQSNQTSTERI